MKKKMIVSLVLVAAMIFGLVGCGSKAPTEKTRPVSTSQSENALRIALTGQVKSLDPELYTQVYENVVIYQMYEPLFNLDNENKPSYVLAEEITVSEDGSKAEVTLVPDVKFHSGDVLTSADVAYTLTRCQNSSLCSDLFTYSEIEVVDDTHFIWNFPYAEMGAGYYELEPAIGAMMIVNESFCQDKVATASDNLDLNVDGTGAYVLEDMATNGDITLKRFADYHGTASIDTIYAKVVTGSEEMAFESGDLDVATYTASTFKALEEYKNVATETVTINSVSFMINNCTENSVMNDIRVREASVRAMNREDVGMTMCDGGGVVAYNMATPAVTFYGDVCDHYDQDLEKANTLLKEAGYSETNPCKVDLVVMSTPEWVAACEIMKENLEQTYFEVTIKECADLTPYFSGEFDIAAISIGLTNSFTSYAGLFNDESGLNMSGYQDPELLQKIYNSVDEASAQEAMKAVVDTLAYVPVCYSSVFQAYDSNLAYGNFYTAFGSYVYREFSWK